MRDTSRSTIDETFEDIMENTNAPESLIDTDAAPSGVFLETVSATHTTIDGKNNPPDIEEGLKSLDLTVDSPSQTKRTNISRDEGGDTLLHLAIIFMKGSLICNIIWEHIAVAPKLLNSQNKLFQTPLHLAVLTQQIDIVKLLLDGLGVDTALRDHQLRTPLFIAVEKKMYDIAELLLNAGRAPDSEELDLVNDQGVSCFNKAVEMSDDKLVEMLLEHGANINFTERKGGRSALHYAAEKGDRGMVAYLMSFDNINCDLKTFAGDTAIDLAYMNEHEQVVNMLKDISVPIRKRKHRQLNVD